MGVTRKAISMCSMGLVDFRSDKERIARSGRKTLHAQRRGNRLVRRQTAALSTPRLTPFPGQPVPVMTPPGWHLDPSRAGGLRFWDGQRWTEQTATMDRPD
jgi:hypothetical protein